jgi:hypothetical protein
MKSSVVKTSKPVCCGQRHKTPKPAAVKTMIMISLIRFYVKCFSLPVFLNQEQCEICEKEKYPGNSLHAPYDTAILPPPETAAEKRD